MLKRMALIVAVMLLVAGAAAYVVLSQSSTCVPGARDVEYNGRVLEDAWVTCVKTEYVASVPGMLPIGANVKFNLNGAVLVGEVRGYQWTEYPEQWPVGQRHPVVYLVDYPGGSVGITPAEIIP